MKRYLVIVINIVFIFIVYPNNIIAEERILSDDCNAEVEEKYNKFIDEVFDDVLNTHRYLNKENNNNNVLYFTAEDLYKVKILIGETNNGIESLNTFFSGASVGGRRLYFFNGEPNYAYLLYKDTSHNNVMVKLNRVDGKWVKSDKKVEKGRIIELNEPKCLDEYNLNQMQ